MDKLNCFSLTTNDHVAHLVLNKPESFNTMHPTFWRELDTVLHQLNDAGQARALVISSTGNILARAGYGATPIERCRPGKGFGHF